ncbi:FecR family protein [Rhodohalobacter sp. 614A]|uniref:FecR family protein n=1 Tax=Rhodohalobacter sp. 614A TaxID=2908649 RepID=UPI001F29F966|nr:FecR family protein [Rhodohalobacter sp. 614A]
MDKELLKKYFRNQCTLEEIEEILSWFQTEEGKLYFEESLDKDMQQYADDDRLLLYPDVPTDEILNKIRTSKKTRITSFDKSHRLWPIRIAVAFLISAVLGGVGYFSVLSQASAVDTEQANKVRTIATQQDQHRLVTLSDGTQIRLNSNSSIEIPNHFPPDERVVSLSGEAWFDVAGDKNRPFRIEAGQAAIQVLGTEFNVKMDETAQNIQVAVAEGTVSLKNSTDVNGHGAILTKNTLGVLNVNNREILIEQTPVDNYLSWISGKLFFYNDPLWTVSRYIERLYNVSVHFDNEYLKTLPLSTNMSREDLTGVLNIIAQTLGISYSLENNTVTWKDNANPKHITQ